MAIFENDRQFPNALRIRISSFPPSQVHLELANPKQKLREIVLFASGRNAFSQFAGDF
jgi:hypothetical protein